MWRNWKKRQNLIQVFKEDVLVPGQYLVLKSERGISSDVHFIKRAGYEIIIRAIYPFKEIRSVAPKETLYRKQTERDTKIIGNTLKCLRQLLKELSLKKCPNHSSHSQTMI